MNRHLLKFLTLGIVMSVSVAALSTPAFAHVVVRPAEVVSASFQTFTVSVPNEKNTPTVRVKILIPIGVQHVSPTQKTGWNITSSKDGISASANTTAITWSGGVIGVGLRDDFTFSAQVPSDTTELQWKAYQTYADGTVVSWDKATDGGHDDASGPLSVTNVVQQTQAQKSDEATANLDNKANFALYAGIAGIVVGLVGIYLSTRK